MSKKRRLIPELDFSQLAELDMSLPFSLDTGLEERRPKISKHKSFSYKRYLQRESGEQPLNAYEQYQYEQRKTYFGEYFL